MNYTLNNKKYTLRHDWYSTTIADMVAISKLDYESEVVDQVLNNDFSEEAYSYITDVLCLLSKADKDDFKEVTRIEKEVMFEFVDHIIRSMYTLEEISYQPNGLTRIKHGGLWYDIPETVNFDDDIILCYKEPAKNMTEASNLMKAIQDLKINGFDSMPYLCALWLKPVEGELYDDKKVIERAKLFRDLPAFAAWEVFFCITNFLARLAHVSIYSNPEAQNRSKMNRMADSIRGYLQSVKAESQVILSRLKK